MNEFSISNFVVPLEDRVLIDASAEEEKASSSLIVLPETSKDKQDTGVVVAVGSGVRDSNGNLIEMSVKVGDKVVYGKWAGQELTVEDKKYIIVKQSDILVKFAKK